jgi:hypothetical protein
LASPKHYLVSKGEALCCFQEERMDGEEEKADLIELLSCSPNESADFIDSLLLASFNRWRN